MTKCIPLILLLSCISLTLTATPDCTTCFTPTSTETVTLSRAEAIQQLLSQTWQTEAGAQWQFLSNGQAVGMSPEATTPTTARWTWPETATDHHIRVDAAEGTVYFLLPIAYGTVSPSANVTCLKASKNETAAFRSRQLAGQWRTSLGRAAGTQELELSATGTYTLTTRQNGTTNTVVGYWTLAPGASHLVLFDRQSAQAATLTLPYLELDEMVLQPAGDSDSFFYNRI